MSITRPFSPAEAAPSPPLAAKASSLDSHAKDNARQPKVAILLCTYNGARYLEEQLASFESQTHANWHLWASDDGSSDETLAILQRCQQNWGPQRLTIVNGPRAGSTRNFMSLVHNSSVEANYYAFSDQDDIWENDKIERAVAWLEGQPPTLPALYCSRTRVVDEHNNAIGFSSLHTRPPSFRNALMQNIAGGNTMVFNSVARSLLDDRNLNVVIHDWWVYLAVTAFGGKVHYDAYPSLRYRQHQNNLIGMNSNWSARWTRIRKLFQGHFQAWTDQNIAALQAINRELPSENRELLERFALARQKPLPTRLASLRQLGLYRQTTLGNVGLIAAAIFKKL